MKNIRVFFHENFDFLEVKFSIYLNRRVFVMLLFVCMSVIAAVLLCLSSVCSSSLSSAPQEGSAS